MIPISSGSTNWKESCTSKAKSTRRWKGQLVYCGPFSMDHEQNTKRVTMGITWTHVWPEATLTVKFRGVNGAQKLNLPSHLLEGWINIWKGIIAPQNYFVKFDFLFFPGILAIFKYELSYLLLNQLSGNISSFMSDLLPALFDPFCSAAIIPSSVKTRGVSDWCETKGKGRGRKVQSAKRFASFERAKLNEMMITLARAHIHTRVDTHTSVERGEPDAVKLS